MKVILEAQHAVGHPELRGVGYYSLELINALLKRKTFDYGLTFFDYNKEVGNRVRAEQYFGKYNVPFFECNELDYRIATRDESVFAEKSYNDYTGTNGDIYHFMCPVSIPTNLKGKMILTIHDVIWNAYPGMVPPHTEELHRIAEKRFNTIKPFVIADSKAAAEDILNYTDIPEENLKVVYISYDDINMYPEACDVSDIVEGRYFLFIGAFERRKNIAAIIKSFDAVAEKYSDIKLVIVGKKVWDDTTDMDDAIEKSKHRDRIIFTGYVDNSTKRRLLSNAEAFVFPSLCEGFGIPVLEAMACGCPVITADNSSLPEVGGDAAIYVDARNTEQLVYEMTRILDDSQLRSSMIEKGFVQKSKFSWEKTAEQVEEIYRKVSMI
ncbi:MAG: glycosyltransferase family 4 protein [Ruminococcus sp.]|nr:glycosyltransferase family 4 protein [Ruminococcus sp.]